MLFIYLRYRLTSDEHKYTKCPMHLCLCICIHFHFHVHAHAMLMLPTG